MSKVMRDILSVDVCVSDGGEKPAETTVAEPPSQATSSPDTKVTFDEMGGMSSITSCMTSNGFSYSLYLKNYQGLTQRS